MDDILLFYAKNAKWDQSECYVKPLCLDDFKKGTFLETRFEIENGKTVKHWLKNDNEDGTKKRFGGILISIAMGPLHRNEPYSRLV